MINKNIADATIGFIFCTGIAIIIKTIDKIYNNTEVLTTSADFLLTSSFVIVFSSNFSFSELSCFSFFSSTFLPVSNSSVLISNNSQIGIILSKSGVL